MWESVRGFGAADDRFRKGGLVGGWRDFIL